MKRSPDSDYEDIDDDKGDGGNLALCASCDRCRARKTRCDGKRPCSNCAAKYMKKYKVKSVEGLDPDLFECIYSPAKRRGPVPGRVGQVRKANEALERQLATGSGNNLGSQGISGLMNFGGGINDAPINSAALLQQQQALSGGQQLDELGLRQLMMAQQAQAQSQNAMALQAGLGLDQGNWGGSGGGGGGGAMYDASMGGMGGASAIQQHALQQHLSYLQQLQAQQMLGTKMDTVDETEQQPAARKVRLDSRREDESTGSPRVPDTMSAHLHKLSKSDAEGNRLRAYYRLSVDELFTLPGVPSDEEYCNRLDIPTPRLIPTTHHHALLASRFAEVALGALVHNEISLAMELCNATVHCLRKCVEEPVQQSCLFEVSRAYFLLGTFRAFRGDMERYFKYRRVSMTHLSQLDEGETEGTEMLLAAVSFFDSWAYMMYNANERQLPNIDNTIPRLKDSMTTPSNVAEKEYNVRTTSSCIASDPQNQMWIQGAPPVFLNNDAALPARSLDALACAIRTCCDQANDRFAALAKEVNPESPTNHDIPQESIITPTATAVLAHENELCSRNMVLSAFTLLQQYESSTPGPLRYQGHHLIISAMDAFLENGDKDGSSGFTDSQIQSLLSVCNTIIENPLLLYHGGPTYHMVSNAAVLLCHLLNGMHAMNNDSSAQSRDMEAVVFEEILDTFLAVRKLLNVHRRKLPVKLRCHGIPRPSLMGPKDGKPYIDLGDTLMCACRGCQGFVLMACSPCVAAERAQTAAMKREMEAVQEEEDPGEFQKELYDIGNMFDNDDDALLNMLSRIITT